MSNSKNNLKSLVFKNLTRTNSIETIIVAQFLKTLNNTVLFDLREFYKGKATKTGIRLPLCEYRWFLKAVLPIDSSIHILEHNNGTITVDKTNDEYLITVEKTNGKIEKMDLDYGPILSLMCYFIEMEEILEKDVNLSKPLKFDFGNNEFFRITIK